MEGEDGGGGENKTKGMIEINHYKTTTNKKSQLKKIQILKGQIQSKMKNNTHA